MSEFVGTTIDFSHAPMHPRRTLAQEAGIATGGIDISDPSVFKKYEWGIVCAQIMLFPQDQLPMVTKCSAKLEKLVEMSKSACDKPRDDAGVQFQAGVCQAVKTMVRLYCRLCQRSTARAYGTECYVTRTGIMPTQNTHTGSNTQRRWFWGHVQSVINDGGAMDSCVQPIAAVVQGTTPND